VDKSVFLQVLQHYDATSVEEAKEIASLKGKFPYSQLLQTLSARVSKDHGFQNQQTELQLAAVYAADRSLLKEIITARPEEPVHQVISEHVQANELAVSTIDSVDVADVVMDDLVRLAKLKNTFENLFMGLPKSIPKATTETVADKTPARILPPVVGEASIPQTESVEEVQPLRSIAEVQKPLPETSKIKTATGKSKKERIIEMARALKTGIGEGRKSGFDKHGNPVDALIAEIQSSKDEIIPENEKQKQQIEIINQFIRIQPSISSPKDRAPSPIGDLNPVKSGEFGDNIVSETLVEILIKQGKKDKAIEVLKKLIWKYPQKKAYFASQIEDLKK
jgi:hypothetical protein